MKYVKHKQTQGNKMDIKDIIKNKATKKMIKDAALTHASAYAWEYIDEQIHSVVEESRQLDCHNNIESLCKNIQQLYNKRDQELGGNTYWPNSGKELAQAVRSFYEAMLKVCPNYLAQQFNTEQMEHSGTEDRGWYRVWSDLTGYRPYFCFGDAGRDGVMANVFYEQGCVSKNQYQKYRARLTLKMLTDSWGYGYMREDGSLNIAKFTKGIDAKWKDKLYDTRILNALKEEA
jgi:hypothetical protein